MHSDHYNEYELIIIEVFYKHAKIVYVTYQVATY